MTKELFIECIEAIRKQYELDVEIAKGLGKVFPDAFHANLLPRNHFLSNALLKVLQVEMNDEITDSWIEYFLWELDFGKKNKELEVKKDGETVLMSTPGELYDFLFSNK